MRQKQEHTQSNWVGLGKSRIYCRGGPPWPPQRRMVTLGVATEGPPLQLDRG